VHPDDPAGRTDTRSAAQLPTTTPAEMAWKRQANRTPAMSVGSYAVKKIGVARFDYRDPYHIAVAIRWPYFLLLIVALYLIANVGFALCYLAQPGAIANAQPGAFSDAFFFSVETSGTVGYGEMYPATTYAHAISTAEILFGMMFTALTTGLLFVRFSRPKAKVRYARNAVVTTHDGHPTLMIRIANGRLGLLANAVAYLGLVVTRRGENGELLRQVYELPLARSQLPIFALTWTLTHEIDESSPLHGYDADRIAADDVRLLLVVQASDVTLAAGIIDMKDYGPADIRFGMRYANVLSVDAERHLTADLNQLSRIEPDIGPEPARSGWIDQR
jgi:inward rectifier potassium channel